MKIIFLLIQVLIVIFAAPLISGLIKKIKNNIRMRKGAPVLQPYYNLIKLFKKDETVSKTTSYIFRLAPYVVITASLSAVFLAPFFYPGLHLTGSGDVFVIIFIFALGRFFMALAGLDSGSAFGGMGSSREMFLSSLAEPALITALIAVSLNSGSTSVAALASFGALKISLLFAGLAFYFVLLAETSRVPVDNQETHLELTMIHEAMILEYSGKSLALIELAGYIKQFVLFALLVNIFIPVGTGPVFFTIKVLLVAIITAVIEVSIAKMRLFRAVDFLIFSFIFSFAAVIAVAAGV